MIPLMIEFVVRLLSMNELINIQLYKSISQSVSQSVSQWLFTVYKNLPEIPVGK